MIDITRQVAVERDLAVSDLRRNLADLEGGIRTIRENLAPGTALAGGDGARLVNSAVAVARAVATVVVLDRVGAVLVAGEDHE